MRHRISLGHQIWSLSGPCADTSLRANFVQALRVSVYIATGGSVQPNYGKGKQRQRLRRCSEPLKWTGSSNNGRDSRHGVAGQHSVAAVRLQTRQAGAAAADHVVLPAAIFNEAHEARQNSRASEMCWHHRRNMPLAVWCIYQRLTNFLYLRITCGVLLGKILDVYYTLHVISVKLLTRSGVKKESLLNQVSRV